MPAVKKAKKSRAKKTVKKNVKQLPVETLPISSDTETIKKPSLINKIINNKFKVFSVAILLISCFIWSYFGAKLQQYNSDQLINALLFKDFDTFKNANFPGQHTFLIKWPLFVIISLLKFSNVSYICLTVFCVLVTVAGLAYIIHKVDNRPMVFGTICLAMASCLMLVPTVSYPGALLPVSMAMITTRNIEYLVFVIALVLLIRAKKLRSISAYSAILLFGLLFISDKLFFSLGLIAGLLALFYYAAIRRWSIVKLAITWLWATFLAALIALLLALTINGFKLTNLVSASGVGPYGLISSIKEFVIGLVYAVMGILTNMGANPAFAQRKIAEIPHDFLQGLLSPQGVGYLINIVVVIYAFLATIALVWASSSSKRQGYDASMPAKLALTMTWGLLAIIGLFVTSNHYYPVDARYLGLAPFTLFLVIAYHVRRRNYQNDRLAIISFALFIGILFGLFGLKDLYQKHNSALQDINSRNQRIAELLRERKTNNLAGDYWRVVPIKQYGRSNVNIISQSACNQQREILSSNAWNRNLKEDSFAYVLTTDGNVTDYKGCKLKEVISKYGLPNDSKLIEGNLSVPKELLLFYDGNNQRGTKKNDNQRNNIAPVIPIDINELNNTQCFGPTIINVVAHQDDDLLFINPDIASHIRQDYCVRTIYLTAGDAGSTGFYYSSREEGARAAYDKMLNQKSTWINRVVRLKDGQYVTISNPKDNDRVSLIFMHLPDGNMKGQGFKKTGYASLEKLNNGSLKRIYSIDKQSNYSKQELIDALVKLFWLYQPSEFNTQSRLRGDIYKDHSDHMATGSLATLAVKKYNNQQYRGAVNIPINYYVGYPIHDRKPNLQNNSLEDKLGIFLEYAKYDRATCRNEQKCLNDQAYGAYINRGYTNKY